ncbi:ankyrin repeat-containing domain protein [Trichoderma sp. SZMC 28011]
METSEDDQPSSIEFWEGYHLDGLTLMTIKDSTQQESDTDKSPDIDVVHVMPVGQADERMMLDTLLLESVASRRREFVFLYYMQSLLAGEFTGQFIDGLARKLLQNLIFFQQRDEKTSRRALVFVSYDLGDLIVKKAISIAGANEQEFPGIFTSAAQFIFAGGFQRANDSPLLYSKVFDFLMSRKNNSWERALTPESISSLTKCTVEITEAFIASKITLRSQVISLYANVEGQEEKISHIFDNGTATMGVPNEIIVREEKQKDKEPFPVLRDVVCSNIKSWLPHESWIPFQQSLLAVTSAHRPLSSTSLDESHPVFKSAEHETWMASAGARILYVSGDDHNAVTEAAEQVFLDWRRKQRKNRKEGVVFLPISFVFSARDPTRCSMKDMISLLLVSYLSGIAIAKGDPLPGAIRDQLVLQHAWTETDLFKLLAIFSREFMGFNLVLLLQNIDECDKHSRDTFWDVLSAIATKSETRFKVVVTCGKSLDFRDELRHWADIPVDTWILSDNKSDSNEDAGDEYPDDLVSTFCPGGHGETEIRPKLEELRPMKKENRDVILKLIGEITNWPQELSTKALHQFSSHLRAVTLASTPADVLRKALRSVADQEGLSWILKWLFKGQRPLSYRELAMMLYHYKRVEAQNFQSPSSMELDDFLSQIRLWFRGITESVSGQVRVKEELRDYLQNELSSIWAESTLPDAITTFLLNYLKAPTIQQRLESINKEYQSRAQAPGEAITPPLISDGQDIIFYAIQALPYHLSENPVVLKSIKDELMASDSKLATWSKAYWAMSNPFSRPESGVLTSPCEILLALGDLKPEAVTILKEMQHSLLSSTTGSDAQNSSPKSPDLDSLSKAIREANEDVAVSIAEELISASKRQDQDYEHVAATKYSSKIPWPSWFLWRAVYLNMVRLVTLLVNDGVDLDPADGGPEFFPSPLYMASRLCHDQIIDVLIEHGADLHVKRLNKYKPVQTATSNGSMHGVKLMVAKDASLLESQEPETPLYFAALEGGWAMAKMLLDLGADPNSGLGERPNYRWAPLVVAVEGNHLKTVKILLENKADPNICGPNNLDTPLWFAAIKAASADMVRLLLDHNADPNHELLDPPLPIELIRSSVSVKDKLAIFEVLVKNSPPVRINATDSENMTPLLYAAEAGELSLVTWLLEREADVNATDNLGRSALWYAIKNLRVEVVRELLNWKPQLNNLTTSGQPLVEIAIEDVEIMRMLLDAGIDMEQPNYNNHTVLNIAVDWKKTDVVRLLVERKANMYHRGNGGWNAIMISAWSTADPQILRILADGGANLGDVHPDTGSTPLHFAMAWDEELAKIILEYRKSIDLEKRNNYGRTPLLYACGEDNEDCIELLIKAGADVNAEDQWGWTVLSLVARRGLKACVTDLLLAQPDLVIDATGKTKGTALMVSCRSLNREMATKLLAHGADANISVKELSYNSTAIKSACIPWKELYDTKKDEMDGIISELIANGADVNAVGGCNIYNAICAASFAGFASTINLLLDKGASAQDPDPLGRLPIHYAAANGVKNFEAIALVHKGDILVRDRAGKNALHWAAQFGNVKTIEAILELLDSSPEKRREYVNQADIDGWTPLCWAVRPVTVRLGPDAESEPRDYVKTVKYLIEQGADCSVKFTMGTGKNVETFTPLQMARLCGAASEIIDMLETSLDDNLANGTERKSSDANKPTKRYKSKTAYCDICLNTIFGHSYQCQTCPDFDTCKKCYGRIDFYHNDISSDDEKQHSFAFRKDYEQEFEDLPAEESPDPDNGNQEDVRGKDAERSDDGELQKNEDDETDDLGLGSLDDLDELEVAEDDTRVTAKYSIKPVKPRKADPSSTSADESSSPSDPKPPRGSLVLKTYDPVSGVALKYRTTKAAEVTRLMYAAMGRLGRAQAGVQDVPEETMQDADAVETPQGEQTPTQQQQQGAAGGGGGKKKKKGKK